MSCETKGKRKPKNYLLLCLKFCLARSPENFGGFLLLPVRLGILHWKWRGLFVIYFWSPFPMKWSTKLSQTFQGKFGAKFGAKFGTKFGKPSFCNFSDLMKLHVGCTKTRSTPLYKHTMDFPMLFSKGKVSFETCRKLSHQKLFNFCYFSGLGRKTKFPRDRPTTVPRRAQFLKKKSHKKSYDLMFGRFSSKFQWDETTQPCPKTKSFPARPTGKKDNCFPQRRFSTAPNACYPTTQA